MGEEEKVYLKVLRRSRTILIRCKIRRTRIHDPSRVHRDEVFQVQVTAREDWNYSCSYQRWLSSPPSSYLNHRGFSICSLRCCSYISSVLKNICIWRFYMQLELFLVIGSLVTLGNIISLIIGHGYRKSCLEPLITVNLNNLRVH